MGEDLRLFDYSLDDDPAQAGQLSLRLNPQWFWRLTLSRGRSWGTSQRTAGLGKLRHDVTSTRTATLYTTISSTAGIL
jgi:hypothetical protein